VCGGEDDHALLLPCCQSRSFAGASEAERWWQPL